MSIRKKFISLTSPFTSVLPLDVLCTLTGQTFIMPFYHIVSDGDCPHIRHLYRFKSAREFEADLDYLTAHYLPIASTDLPDVLAGKYKGKKIMLLSFDDGLRQMYDIVAPVLRRRGIPAIFFLNNDFIDNKALMWRYKMSLALEADYDRYYAVYDAHSDEDIAEATNNELNGICADFLRHYQPYMTTGQVSTLVSQGFAIGGHSLDHPYYSDLTLQAQLHQTLSSVDELQKAFSLTQRLFAFPFTDAGISKGFFRQIFDEGKIDFSFGGAGIKHDIDPRQMQRIPMEGWDATAGQTLKSEYLYYLLRIPLFKNSIVRM